MCHYPLLLAALAQDTVEHPPDVDDTTPPPAETHPILEGALP
jgi:hypothetical protein